MTSYPLSCPHPWSVLLLRQVGNGADRWFDKHQLIVLGDGTVRSMVPGHCTTVFANKDVPAY